MPTKPESGGRPADRGGGRQEQPPSRAGWATAGPADQCVAHDRRAAGRSASASRNSAAAASVVCGPGSRAPPPGLAAPARPSAASKVPAEAITSQPASARSAAGSERAERGQPPGSPAQRQQQRKAAARRSPPKISVNTRAIAYTPTLVMIANSAATGARGRGVGARQPQTQRQHAGLQSEHHQQQQAGGLRQPRVRCGQPARACTARSARLSVPVTP